MEKVLLVDADMRRPSIAQAFGLAPDVLGLTELMAKTTKLEECVIHTKSGRLDVLPTGNIPPDALQLLSSRRLASAFRVLRIKYDRIIIDSPPVLPVSDSAVLSTHADAVVIVVKSEATTVHQLKAAVDRLRRVDAPMTGVVLNQWDSRKANRYSDYGYGGYYQTVEPEQKMAS